ncbi:MAG: radical SAM protein [Verrucomicrobia bacterium]|nr:radical SAM protein [Verrucomicrobiota bacterium]
MPPAAFDLASIRRLHVELTSACNARCPMCPRNLDGGPVNPTLPVTQLRSREVEKMLPPDFRAQLRHVRFCGNYGDPIMAHDLPSVCALFRESNAEVKITVHTNGGLRDVAWWRRLAAVVDCVRFGLDGLGDTNHLYRRGVAWEHALRAAAAFIEAGGRAEWDFLVFRHNEHQVEQARALAAELGFARFQAKRTKRFLRDGKVESRYPVRNARGALEAYLEAPRSPEWRNEAVAEAGRSWEAEPAGYEGYLATTPIACKALHEHELYLSADGRIFPCCYLAQIHDAAPGSDARQVRALLEAQPDGLDSLDLRRHALAEIVAGPVFQEIARRWAPTPDRLRTCAKQCGQRDFFGAQFAAAAP